MKWKHYLDNDTIVQIISTQSVSIREIRAKKIIQYLKIQSGKNSANIGCIFLTKLWSLSSASTSSSER